jgi:hypothetical protein
LLCSFLSACLLYFCRPLLANYIFASLVSCLCISSFLNFLSYTFFTPYLFCSLLIKFFMSFLTRTGKVLRVHTVLTTRLPLQICEECLRWTYVCETAYS